jgi:hypothetical protein
MAEPVPNKDRAIENLSWGWTAPTKIDLLKPPGFGRWEYILIGISVVRDVITNTRYG